ncbi:hypothetical protein CRG98_027100 [Punica granatum]|uniref:C2 domain-containing protein n=1 Tax=Punica granatum TaxID=22663 RepID=A0A2I0J8G4_PUNGR|nr:hypothetical protein CRG98_027100 [Punica granatum]
MEDSPSLELKLLYGKDITAFNFFQKLNVYVAASISSDKPDKKLDRAQQQRTPADKEGDGSPEWGHDLRFDLKGIDFRDSNDVFLRLDLFHEGVMFGDKPIGEVRIPLRDLTAQADGVARFVSYQVKGIDGKPNGVLSFSYKVNGAGQATGIGPVDSTNGITGYVISHHHQGNQETPLPAIGNPYPGTTLYPTVGEESASAPSAPPLETLYPPPGTYYSLTPEGYYPHHPPPPPPPPPMIYPGDHLCGRRRLICTTITARGAMTTATAMVTGPTWAVGVGARLRRERRGGGSLGMAGRFGDHGFSVSPGALLSSSASNLTTSKRFLNARKLKSDLRAFAVDGYYIDATSSWLWRNSSSSFKWIPRTKPKPLLGPEYQTEEPALSIKKIGRLNNQPTSAHYSRCGSLVG